GLGRLRLLLADPLFLKTPKGVVPTQRAEELGDAVADILSRVRRVVATAQPFDPATSTRRFTIGSPDGVSAVFLPPLMERLSRTAAGIAIGIRQLLPRQDETSPILAWKDALADLETRVMDVAIVPNDEFPARFARRPLYQEDFVVAARAGHPFATDPSLSNYCAMQHLVVSQTGDPHGFVDNILSEQGLSRQVALTVPNFMFALAVLSGSDLISALPRRFVEMHAARFGVVGVDAPIPFGRFTLNIVTPQVAMRDPGIEWLVGLLREIGAAWPN
ncbi:LysR substrate-binding domain-containing protein, partial [Mesorhizobium sp. IMUNJ 23232]|uniref:LysR substrate-binding domain-containing protein n=1 Tax=Mesorhizobium sp. IMUNJ 23232 TaxID=3376064 RepID=UPI00379E98D0